MLSTMLQVIRYIKYSQMDSHNSKEFVDILNNMLGEDSASIEAHSTYMDYVKVWTKVNDHGGLTHVSIGTFHCFKPIKMVFSFPLFYKKHSNIPSKCNVHNTQ